jgi:hypothetical protein
MKAKNQDRVKDFLKHIVKQGLSSENRLDWNNFYMFIALAHSHRRRWDHHDVMEMLVEYGVQKDQAKMFSEVYWHGRCLLYNQDHFNLLTPQYSNWVRQDGTPLS